MKAPESVAAAARVRAREAAAQRQRVLQAVWSGRPLDAEPDVARKVSRFQAATGVSQEQAERLARDADPASLGLTGDARIGAERIQGKTADFLGVAFLDLARTAASAVGRVIFRDLQPQGSGFMISDRLFLTNNHVISSTMDARRFLVEFDYELDVDGRAKAMTRFELAPDDFFVTNAEDDLDFTVVALGERVSGTGLLPDFGYCPLRGTSDKHILGEFVNVVQHPDGDYKQIVLRENRLVTRLETVLHYMTDTMPGSSGAPVFNDQWEVVALHHWGEPFREIATPDGRPVQRDLNEGIRISAIVRALQADLTGIGADRRPLLDAAFKPRLRHPAGVREPERHPDTTTSAVPTPDRRRPEIGADGTATWTIPVEISVRVGGTTAPATERPTQPVGRVEEPVPVPAGEAIQIDRNYSNRRGYNPAFLPGHRVELPQLTAAQRAQAARRMDAGADEDPFELTYQHFSVVMNAERRMAFLTAVNVDGSTWISVDRETGEPREAEAREVWFDDPRIAPDAQTTQDLYDNQRPRRVFDRGHLVRRQDPAWGTPTRARRANADTFHFTNCAPQESAFNQSPRLWQGIENYVLDNAKAERERVTVLTGPVFADDDPDYRYVKVPMRFWKILVRVEDGDLLATALLADQSDRLQTLPERLREDFDDLGTVAEYQTSVAVVGELTHLDFGPLRDHDTFQPGGEEAAVSKRALTTFDDIDFDAPDRRTRSRRPSR